MSPAARQVPCARSLLPGRVALGLVNAVFVLEFLFQHGEAGIVGVADADGFDDFGGIEGGEQFADRLLAGASVLNLPPPNVGGLTEARKIATLAEMRGMQIAPHFFNYGPLNWVAMANHCMATPNVLILEANALRENPSGPRGLNRNQFFKEPIQFDGYYFVPSGKPGLGYEYDE